MFTRISQSFLYDAVNSILQNRSQSAKINSTVKLDFWFFSATFLMYKVCNRLHDPQFIQDGRSNAVDETAGFKMTLL